MSGGGAWKVTQNVKIGFPSMPSAPSPVPLGAGGGGAGAGVLVVVAVLVALAFANIFAVLVSLAVLLLVLVFAIAGWLWLRGKIRARVEAWEPLPGQPDWWVSTAAHLTTGLSCDNCVPRVAGNATAIIRGPGKARLALCTRCHVRAVQITTPAIPGSPR